MECIGWTDSSLKERCPEPVVCEVRVSRDGLAGGKWYSWRPSCERHGEALIKIMKDADGWDAERRDLKEGKAK